MMDPAVAADPQGSVIAILLSHGLPGVVMLVLGWWHWKKDGDWTLERAQLVADLKAESNARAADAKGYTELAGRHATQYADAVSKLNQAMTNQQAVIDEMRRAYRGERS